MTPLSADARVLLVRLSALGDCVHAVPLLTALREQLPDVRIGWAIQRAGYELMREHPEVDRFHLFPRKAGLALPKALFGFRRELRAAGYDAVLDVQGLFKSGLASWLSGSRLRVGFSAPASREGNAAFTNRRIAPHSRHVVDRNLELLAGLGLDVPERVIWSMPDYERTDPLDDFFEAHGLRRREYLVLNPGTTWESKHWPAPKFGELGARLAEELGQRVVLTWGDERERGLCECARESAPDAVLAPATSLRELAALLGDAALVVASDTGPLHLAVALGVKTVGLYGATDPERTGPYGECQEALVVRTSDGELGDVRDISVDQAFDACSRQLALAPVTS